MIELALIFSLGALFGAMSNAGGNRRPPTERSAMRSKFRSAFLGGPKRKAATAAAVLALTATTAIAAWIIFSGVTGSGGGKVGASQISPAIVLTPSAFQAGDFAVEPGVDGSVYADVDNDASVPTRILTLTAGAITSDAPACDTAALSFVANTGAAGVGPTSQLFPVGVTARKHLGVLRAAANLDPDCANSNIRIAFTGTTGP